MVLPSSDEKTSRELPSSLTKLRSGTGRCSVPNPTADRLLKGFEPSAKGFATITNQSTQRPSL